MALWRSGLICMLASGALLLPATHARAGTGDITFCNEFPHTLFIALAYSQADVNNYLSRGWLEIDTGKCYIFDTAIRVPTFYFRAESEPYKDGKHKVTMSWGDDKNFAVRNANFQSYNAEKAYSGMKLVGFNKGPEVRAAARLPPSSPSPPRAARPSPCRRPRRAAAARRRLRPSGRRHLMREAPGRSRAASRTGPKNPTRATRL